MISTLNPHMKALPFLIAGAWMSALSGVAQAESAAGGSSVTLYGVIDTAMVFSNNVHGGKLHEMNSSNVLGNRWGLRGSEDLGGGMSAIFRLENGFSGNTGAFQQGGDEFGRQAFVGLSSTQSGTVTFGRQYDAVVDYVLPFISGTQWASYIGGHPGDLDNTNNDYRSNNAIKYASPSYGGFRFGALYSFGGVAGQFSRNQIWSLGAGFDRGPLRLGAAYVNIKDPNYSYLGNNSTSSTTGSNMSGSRVYSGYASAGSEQILSFAGSYRFGAATVGAFYSNTQFRDLGAIANLNSNGYSGAAKFHNAEVNVRYLVTPTVQLGASYDLTKGYDQNHATYHQADLGVTYFFSKRTQVYLVGIYQHATGTDSTGTSAVANINGLSASSNRNQTATLVGITHSF